MVKVKLVQQPDADVEQGVREAFEVACAAVPSGSTQHMAERAAAALGRGVLVSPEAERGSWSRYRVAIRVQGMPVTIATVEVTNDS